MKKAQVISGALLVASLIGVLMLSACTKEKQTVYKNVQQQELSLAFDRPDNWTDERVSPGQGFTDYVINIPNEKTSENRMKGTIGMSKIDASADEILNLQEEVTTFKNLFKDSKNIAIVEEKETTFLGEKASEIVLEFDNAEDETVREKVVATVTVANNKVYIVVLDDEKSEFKKYLPIYENIRSSMKLLGT